MTDRTFRVSVEGEPELYDKLVSAMMGHGKYQGCYVEQYTEYHEDGQTIAKFKLRDSQGSQPE